MTTLEAIKKRLEAATKGPWEAFEVGSWGGEGFGISTQSEDVDEWFSANADTSTAANNATFIAHSRTDIERLVSALEKAIEQRDREMEKTLGEIALSNEYREYDAELESILRGQS